MQRGGIELARLIWGSWVSSQCCEKYPHTSKGAQMQCHFRKGQNRDLRIQGFCCLGRPRGGTHGHRGQSRHVWQREGEHLHRKLLFAHWCTVPLCVHCANQTQKVHSGIQGRHLVPVLIIKVSFKVSVSSFAASGLLVRLHLKLTTQKVWRNGLALLLLCGTARSTSMCHHAWLPL